MAPLETLKENIGSLVASGHEVLLFHILDPAELRFDFSKATLFLDVESERDLYIDPAAARKDYLRKLQRTGRRPGRSANIWAPLTTCCPPRHRLEIALFDFLRSRMQRAKRVRRN